MLNQVTYTPEWLRLALGLLSPPLPVAVETGAIMPVLDVLQDGWGGAEWTTEMVWASAAPDTLTIAADPQLTRLITGISIEGSAGNAAANVAGYLSFPPNTVQMFSRAALVNATVPWESITVRPWYLVPPGFQFQIIVQDPSPGDIIVSIVIGTMRAGTKPI